jgi:hypothetical protein
MVKGVAKAVKEQYPELYMADQKTPPNILFLEWAFSFLYMRKKKREQPR